MHRSSRAGGRNLLQLLKDSCVSQECSIQSRVISGALHTGRAPAGSTDGADLVTAAGSADGSLGTLLSSGAARLTAGSRAHVLCAPGRPYSTTDGPQIREAQAGAAMPEGSLSQQQPPQAPGPSSREAPQEQRVPFSARLGSYRAGQRPPPPPRRDFGGPDMPPGQDFGFQGRSRQLVNLKQRQVGLHLQTKKRNGSS